MAGVDILATAFNGANASFLADLYARWVADPGAVDPGFADLFEALNDESRAILTDATGASWAPRRLDFGDEPPRKAEPAAPVGTAAIRAATLDSLRALMLIRAYRVRGHLQAQLDPLGLQARKPHAELDPRTYGFTEADMDRPVFIDNVLGREFATVREIVAVLRETYCGPLGVEFMHIQDPDQKAWIQRRIEGAPWLHGFDAGEKETVLRQLTEAEAFEAFCQRRFV
ncbi:MAG: 2-oxoglutarate dehydrogenase E1 component, partial [Acidisphaera sp.]|nr:2-oxoglutarate dehydrogenase E1 component [Acidisphaera sp.]